MEIIKEKAVWRGEVLKAKRENLGKTKVQMADVIGITPQSYGEWEANQSKPDSSNLALLCLILDCPSSHFFDIPTKFLAKI